MCNNAHTSTSVSLASGQPAPPAPDAPTRERARHPRKGAPRPGRRAPSSERTNYLLSPPVLVVILAAVARTLLGGLSGRLSGRLGAVGGPGLRLGLRR